MKILDATCGGREMWFDKSFKDCVYMDIRNDSFKRHNRKAWIKIHPNIKHDITLPIPFCDKYFDLIVFDPPYTSWGRTSTMGKKYGTLSKNDIMVLISKGSKNLYRVLKDDDFLIFKWGEMVEDRNLEKVVNLFYGGFKPLFGHKSSHNTNSTLTYWILFIKKANYDKGLDNMIVCSDCAKK